MLATSPTNRYTSHYTQASRPTRSPRHSNTPPPPPPPPLPPPPPPPPQPPPPPPPLSSAFPGPHRLTAPPNWFLPLPRRGLATDKAEAEAELDAAYRPRVGRFVRTFPFSCAGHTASAGTAGGRVDGRTVVREVAARVKQVQLHARGEVGVARPANAWAPPVLGPPATECGIDEAA